MIKMISYRFLFIHFVVIAILCHLFNFHNIISAVSALVGCFVGLYAVSERQLNIWLYLGIMIACLFCIHIRG